MKEKKAPTIAELRARVARGELKAAMCIQNRCRSDTGLQVPRAKKAKPPAKKPPEKPGKAEEPKGQAVTPTPWNETEELAKVEKYLRRAERAATPEDRKREMGRAELILDLVEYRQMQRAKANIQGWKLEPIVENDT